jgi:hypothetical protein
MKKEKTGQTLGGSSRTCPPNLDSRSLTHHFNQWERWFELELKTSDVLLAWQTLVDNYQCDPRALKSALYYAAENLWASQEAPLKWAAYSQARKSALIRVAELEEALGKLAFLQFGREEILDSLLIYYQAKENDVIFLKTFPKLLQQLQRILTGLKLPQGKRRRAFFRRNGEALLHVYLKETAGKLFPGEAAVLLRAAARSYGLKRGPRYSGEAVEQRFKRYRNDKFGMHKLFKMMVRQFTSERSDLLLHQFVDIRITEMFYKLIVDSLESLP